MQCEGVTYTFSAIIIILEVDVPVLSVIYPSEYNSGTVNMNQLLYFTLNLTANQNPDTMALSYALVYNFNVENTVVFKSASFSLRIWDTFVNLQQSTQVTLRISAYDPNFYMPSIAQITLNVNISPQYSNNSLSVKPSNIVAG